MYIILIFLALACIAGSAFTSCLLLLLPIAIVCAVVYIFKQFGHSVKIFKHLHSDSSESIYIPGYENEPNGTYTSAFMPASEPVKEEPKVEPKVEPNPVDTPENEVVVFHLPDEIDGATVAYQYEEVVFALDCAEDPDPYMAKELRFERNASKILVKHDSIQIGFLKPGKITDMVRDWLNRGDPIRAFLTAYDQDESSGEFTIVFYRDALKHAKRRGTAVKEYKLTGNKSAAAQEECCYASIDDRCTIEYDYDKEKYAVHDETYSLYGYLPAAGAKFFEEHDSNCIAVVTNVELDDEDRTVIYVALYAQ